MPLEPSKWTVIVVGAWNRAILTPSGIVTRLFGHPEGTEVSIEVPINAIGPFRVHCDGLVVIAANNALSIEMEESNTAGLRKAKQIAARAIESLPETPVTAVGINIRYAIPCGDPLIGLIENAITSPLDERLAKNGQEDIRAKGSARRIGWGRGTIGIEAAIENDSADLTFNFDCRDDRDDLVSWLEIAEADILEQTRGLLCSAYSVDKKDLP